MDSMNRQRLHRVMALALLACGLGQAGCGGDAATAYAYSVQGTTMGTTYTVRIADTDQPGREQELRELVQSTVDAINARMSTYEPASEVSALNQHTGVEPMALSADTFFVLDSALQLSRDSGSAFDPTIGALINAWGFGPINPATTPSFAEIESIKEHTGVAKLELDPAGSSVRKLDPLLYVDLSAIAKGYAVDAVAERLQDAGLRNFMVEIGGEIRTAGERSPGTAWRIGIERPDVGAQHIQRLVPLVDLAMATSGNYRNFYVMDGRTVGHTIDPRSGQPIDHNGASVSVIHEQCMMADALATVLMVMGPTEGLAWAEQRGLAALFVVHDGSTFVERATPEFERLAALYADPAAD